MTLYDVIVWPNTGKWREANAGLCRNNTINYLINFIINEVPTVMFEPHKCFYYMVTIALAVITDCLICTDYLRMYF